MSPEATATSIEEFLASEFIVAETNEFERLSDVTPFVARMDALLLLLRLAPEEACMEVLLLLNPVDPSVASTVL
jgi:hypothetical protein